MPKESTAILLPRGVTVEKCASKITAERTAAFEYQKRRHAQWDENYFLFRDKVQLNRLTQRHAVNVPIMKETIRTILPKVDEKPDVMFEDKAGDLERELYLNEKWSDDFDGQNMELIDYADKKQVLLYGRSHKKLNWYKDGFQAELKDIYDLLVDPCTNPLDIETARFLTEPRIFRALDEILDNEEYDKTTRARLKKAYKENGENAGRSRSAQNKEIARAREQRLVGIGAKSEDEVIGFETYSQLEELTQHYTHIFDRDKKRFVRYVFTLGPDDGILKAKPLKDCLNVDFWPFEGWADDLEISDYHSDAIADLIRTPNQVINIWLSQFLENRTLRNYGMNFYDSTIEGFSPATFQPRPGGWYPVPGKPQDVYQRVDIPDLSSTINEIQFIISLAEKASATGAIDKGVVEAGKRTLGEIEIAVGKAEERTTSMAKFYRISWKRYGQKWYDLTAANIKDGQVKMYRKNPKGKMVGKEFKRDELVSPEGVNVVVTSGNQRTSDKVDKIQRLMAVKQEFPDNPPLNKAIQKRLISLADLTPEEAQEIEAYEAKKITESVTGPMMPGKMPGMPGMTPGKPPATAEGIDAMLNEAGVQVQPT